jgi:hypothetical protein
MWKGNLLLFLCKFILTLKGVISLDGIEKAKEQNLANAGNFIFNLPIC